METNVMMSTIPTYSMGIAVTRIPADDIAVITRISPTDAIIRYFPGLELQKCPFP